MSTTSSSLRQSVGIALLALCFGPSASLGWDREQPALAKADLNGVELHYRSIGEGIPVVFVHGALDDYRMWDEQVGPFAQHYRAVVYSRRYNYPNHNEPRAPHYSAMADADDLAALINKLRLGRVHLVAHSYGGYAALFLAVQHPELVRSLVLAEPAALCWARDNPAARSLFLQQMATLWEPSREAFRRGNGEEALRVALEYFEGKGAYEKLPEAVRLQLRENLPEWRALSLSSDRFPSLSLDRVAKIDQPVMIMTGAMTQPIFRFVDGELQRRLPDAHSVIIRHAKHEMWGDNGDACRQATLNFLKQH